MALMRTVGSHATLAVMVLVENAALLVAGVLAGLLSRSCDRACDSQNARQSVVFAYAHRQPVVVVGMLAGLAAVVPTLRARSSRGT